ncbi:MAG: PAS domain-containing protein [Bilophila wadsworthia]
MQTIASRSEDVVRRFFDAYLHLRDLDKTLECLADDIRWIGTGDFERAGKGFCDCRELLIEEFKATPGSFDVKLRNLYSVEAGKACYTDGDMSVVDPSSGKGVNVRISAMCGEVPDGRCLIQGIHASLPSGEQPDGEFFPTSFLGEGNELSSQSRRSAFQLLKNSIPGGLIGGYIEKGFPLYFINDQLLGYLGYSSYEDFVEDTGGMVENGIHPGDRDRVNTLVNESMTVTDSYEVSYRMLRRDGSYIWVLDRGLRNISRTAARYRQHRRRHHPLPWLQGSFSKAWFRSRKRTPNWKPVTPWCSTVLRNSPPMPSTPSLRPMISFSV